MEDFLVQWDYISSLGEEYMIYEMHFGDLMENEMPAGAQHHIETVWERDFLTNSVAEWVICFLPVGSTRENSCDAENGRGFYEAWLSFETVSLKKVTFASEVKHMLVANSLKQSSFQETNIVY